MNLEDLAKKTIHEMQSEQELAQKEIIADKIAGAKLEDEKLINGEAEVIDFKPFEQKMDAIINAEAKSKGLAKENSAQASQNAQDQDPKSASKEQSSAAQSQKNAGKNAQASKQGGVNLAQDPLNQAQNSGANEALNAPNPQANSLNSQEITPHTAQINSQANSKTNPQEAALSSNSTSAALSFNEELFLKNIRERILVLFEGLNSVSKSDLEARLELCINFLEFLLANIEDKLNSH